MLTLLADKLGIAKLTFMCNLCIKLICLWQILNSFLSFAPPLGNVMLRL